MAIVPSSLTGEEGRARGGRIPLSSVFGEAAAAESGSSLGGRGRASASSQDAQAAPFFPFFFLICCTWRRNKAEGAFVDV